MLSPNSVTELVQEDGADQYGGIMMVVVVGAEPEEMDVTFGEGLMAQLEGLGAEGLEDLRPPDL